MSSHASLRVAPDTFLFRFSALVVTPTSRVQDEDEDPDDNIDLVAALSPRKPKSKPGPKRKPTADLSRKFPPSATHPTRQKRAFTAEFKLGILSYATYGRVGRPIGNRRGRSRSRRRRGSQRSIRSLTAGDSLSVGSAHSLTAGDSLLAGSAARSLTAGDSLSAGLACALTADDSLSAASVPRAHAAKGLGKVPAAVEPLAVTVLARRSKRLEGVRRQYVVAELFPSISDTEDDDDDGVEFCWRDEA